MGIVAELYRIPEDELDSLVAELQGEEIRTEGLLYLDKAWHGIHVLLTTRDKESRTLSFLQSGGRELEDLDLGTGPGRFLSAREVGTLNAVLKHRPATELRRRYLEENLDRNIYGMSRAPDDGDLAYWIEYYEHLVRFVSEAAAAGQGILIRYT